MNQSIIPAFISAINSHDCDGIASLMTDDHTFIDSHNNSVTGKQTMKSAWKSYFELFPDYEIEITDILNGADCIAMFGFAEGTYRNKHDSSGRNHFHIPAAWKAIVENEKIKLWQVFCDTKIPFDIIERNLKFCVP